MFLLRTNPFLSLTVKTTLPLLHPSHNAHTASQTDSASVFGCPCICRISEFAYIIGILPQRWASQLSFWEVFRTTYVLLYFKTFWFWIKIATSYFLSEKANYFLKFIYWTCNFYIYFSHVLPALCFWLILSQKLLIVLCCIRWKLFCTLQ